MTIYERRNLEIDRVVNLAVDSGWEELSRKLDREILETELKKDFIGLSVGERRMAIDHLSNLVGVFGWTVAFSKMDGDSALVSLTKKLIPEIP